jgi:hypothetical protein
MHLRKKCASKKLCETIFGKRTERHQVTKAESQEKTEEAGKADYSQRQAAGDQAARVERGTSKTEEKPSR